MAINLSLSRDEIKITDRGGFYVPIHQAVLEADLIDPLLAQSSFVPAGDEWHEDLQKYHDGLEESQEKKWIKEVFLDGYNGIYRGSGFDYYLLENEGWSCGVDYSENGFAKLLSIGRNVGTMYFHKDDINCRHGISFSGEPGLYFDLDANKAREFCYKTYDDNSGRAYILIPNF